MTEKLRVDHKHIWLQVNEDRADDEITWAQDSIYDDDILYVHFEEVAALESDLKEALDHIQHDYRRGHNPTYTKSERLRILIKHGRIKEPKGNGNP